MWRNVADWILQIAGLVEDQRKQQAQITGLEKRVRDLEEALRLVSQQTLHARAMEVAEREKLLLRLENAVQNARLALPGAKPRGGKKPR